MDEIKKTGLIYKITNKINGKVYIGQTIKKLGERWSLHKHTNRKSPLTSALKKYGYLNFTIEVLKDQIEFNDLDRIEIEFIENENCIHPNGYNLTKGGPQSAHTRGRAPWNKGAKVTSQETLQKLSEAHKGQVAWNAGQKDVYSKTTLRKMSKAKQGKRISPDTEFKVGQVSTFKGKRHSAKALALISEHGNRKAIECIETSEAYKSILEASIALGVSKSYLRRKMISQEIIPKLNKSFRYTIKKE